MKKKILILSGGLSEEADVSRITASEIQQALQAQSYQTQLIDPADFPSYCEMVTAIKKQAPDIVFNGLHGTDGEDGKIQALLQLENIPFTGSDYNSSALAMDKEISGMIAQQIGIPLPRRLIFQDSSEFTPQQIEDVLGLPLVIKPNNSGSSCGITVISDEMQMIPAFSLAKVYSQKVIFEEFITGRELTVTILGSKALPVVEIKPKTGWYDYANKYTKGNTIYESPAKLSDHETEIIQEFAKRIFFQLGCSVYGRVDFRYDGDFFYFLEVNTLPGMTPLSLTPMAAAAAGIDFQELLTRIIGLSEKRIDPKRK